MGFMQDAMAMKGKVLCPLSTREIVDRVLLVIEALAGVELYTYQSLFARRTVESVIENDGATITALWARQSGKTESVADICLGLAIILPALSAEFPDDPRLMPFAGGCWVGIYAPVKEQSEISFGRIRDKLGSERCAEIMNDPELNVSIVTDRADSVVFSNGSYIYARTASPDTQIEGKTYHIVVCEEAQKLLRTKVEKEIEPMLTATHGTMVKIGTAWESRGGFHLSIQLNQKIHKDRGVRNHFEFPWDIVVAEKRMAYARDGNPFHLNYEKSMNDLIFKLGGMQAANDNHEFRMNYLCKWYESRSIAVNVTAFAAAARKDIEARPMRWGFQVAGLDIGKTNDATVLSVAHVDLEHPIRNPFYMPDSDEDKQNYYRKTLLDWLELMGNFEGHVGQYAQLVQYLSQTNVKVLVIDSTAINGDAVFERIADMIGGSIECVPFKFTSMSKSNLYKYYLQELHSGRFTYAAGPETQRRQEYSRFQQEHLDLDRVDKGGYSVCEAPEGGHDDYPDSAALCAWAEKVAQDSVMPDITVTSASPDGDGDESRWRRGGAEFMGASMLDSSAAVTASVGRMGRYRKGR